MTGQILPPQDGGAYIKVIDHTGHLIIFTEVHDSVQEHDSVRNQVMTKLGVSWHCFNCEGLNPPVRARISAPHVVSKIRTDGNLTLGYIEVMPPKPGFKDGAQILSAPTDVDIANALEWWEKVKVSPIQGPIADPTPAPVQQTDPWAVGPPSGATAAPAPAASPGAPWGAAATPATPAAAPPPTPAATPSPTFAEVQQMSLPAVIALVNAGVITADQARGAGHQVGG